MHDAWKRYRNGDKVTTKELKEMKSSLDAAMPLLQAHPCMGAALFRATHDLTTIEGYLRARGVADLGNKTAESGCDRCDCGCKYWENDKCVDCGTKHDPEKFKEEVA